MGMLFAQKDNEVFNLVLPMDVMHNGLIVMAAGLSNQKVELGERIKPDKAQGMAVSGLMSQEQWLALRPRMIDLNSLIENMRSGAKRGAEESWVAPGSFE